MFKLLNQMVSINQKHTVMRSTVITRQCFPAALQLYRANNALITFNEDSNAAGKNKSVSKLQGQCKNRHKVQHLCSIYVKSDVIWPGRLWLYGGREREGGLN